jgi:putative peptidoglycan lipid II flippase
VAQLATVAIAARFAGIRIRLIRPRLTEGVRTMLWLAAPIAVSGGITQINLFIGQIIASMKPGAIAILQYADRLYQLPLGVVGVAIGVVLLPELSRSLKAGNLAAAEHNQNRALEFALFLTVPAAAALAIASEEIVRVLYERGAFTPSSTLSTAHALAVYGLGLPAFVMIRVFAPGYFAREDTRTPMIFAGISAAVNVVTAVTLFPFIAEAGIAGAESIAGWTNSALLFAVLVRRGHFTLDPTLRRNAPRILFSTALMAAALFGGKSALAAAFTPASGLLTQVGALALLVIGGGIVYLAAAQLTGAADLRSLARSFRRGGGAT